MQYGTVCSTTHSPGRLWALLVALLFVGSMLGSLSASQAGAAETPAAPLGLGIWSRSATADTFAGEKLGVDAAAGQSLWAPSAPRVIVDTGYGRSVEEPSYSSSDDGYAEAAYEEPVVEEPQVCWDYAIASAYGPDCNGGTLTSSGIPLDWDTPTVASLWIPLGTYIEIVYDGMSVIAQVTDRGPYIAGRELDLSPGVVYAFGFESTDDWGVRTVSYRLL